MDVLASVKVEEIISCLVAVVRAKGNCTKGACLKAVCSDVFLMSLNIRSKRNTAVFVVIHCSTCQKGAGTDSGRNTTLCRESIKPEDSILD